MASNLLDRYGDVASLTISLASLANDSTNLLAGQQSTVISNLTDLWPDYKVRGFITTGTSPTAGNTIEIWAFASVNDAPNTTTYPDVFGASDAARTLTSNNVKQIALRHVATITVDSTSNRTYWFAPVSIARLFNGVPPHWGIMVINGSGVALNGTGSNHGILISPEGGQI